MEYPGWFVCLMGMGTVFVGLIILIIAVTIMGKITATKSGSKVATSDTPTGLPKEKEEMPRKGIPSDFDKSLLAAISAAIVADMGTEVDKIRILSLREVEE